VSLQREAHCAVCGDPVKASDWKWFSGKAKGRVYRPARSEKDEPVFAHSDAMKRDHPAIPHDMRTPHQDLMRQAHNREQAQAHVNSTLDRQFLGLQVDDVFRDRRG
jgi:hypothetical protein